MEKVGKIQTIVRAFTQKSNIDENILRKRREICSSCPLNSLNKEKTGVFEEIRKTVVKKPFCTACGCQIEQKTASETEVCGAVYLGQKPKWNRIKVETMKKTDINVINLSEDKMNLDLSIDGSHFVAECGEIDKNVENSFRVRIEGKEDAYRLYEPVPGCGYCTRVFRESISNGVDELNVVFDLSQEDSGVGIVKFVSLTYESSEGVKNTKLEFRFTPK